MFRRIDANQDGKITPTEHAKFWQGWFKRTDKNGDGVLEFEEYDDSRVFARMDKNQDNKVDSDEHDSFRAGHFKILDENQDGKLTLEEYTREL